MASLIFNRALELWARGSIDFDTDTFKQLLVTSTYAPNKDTHDFRDDVTNEVTGTGYTAGGNTVVCTVSIDTVNDRVEMSWAATSWSSSTITARASVIYKSRGGASGADELVLYNDFGSDFASTAGTFSVAANVLRVQN